MYNTAQVMHAIKELQSIRSVAVDGAAAATDIAVAGIKEGDYITQVLFFPDAGDVGELSAEASVTSDGNIQLSTTVTTAGRLVVTWLDHTARP